MTVPTLSNAANLDNRTLKINGATSFQSAKNIWASREQVNPNFPALRSTNNGSPGNSHLAARGVNGQGNAHGGRFDSTSKGFPALAKTRNSPP
ncbi:hypothetical protein FS749_002059 [Ceratobasidium sp. UAMH 11750]|nr:hypothetical protein FS749_002059 [Ceratobasidium sp. UAMH 11750]